MELIKADIDEAIKEATKYQEEFVNLLAFKGYYIKNLIMLYLLFFLLRTIIEI